MATIDSLQASLGAQIQPERLARRTMELVAIPSPSGHEADVATGYAAMLREAGLDVSMDREFPESPSVIARLPGSPGRVLQLDGHLDTVPNPHSPPERRGEVLYGRGTCDMKGGLAVSAEVAQILAESRLRLGGSLLLTAHGQHEEAVPGRGLHAPLLGLLRRGIKGDACIIPEGPHLDVPIAGKGLIIFSVRFSRPGEPSHEILSDPTPPNPILAAHRFISLMQERATAWDAIDPLVGSESFFIGSLHGGDLYNRIPTWAELSGTRRYPVGRTYAEARAELELVAARAAAETGVEVQVTPEKSGQPFRLQESDPIVVALRDSYRKVAGRDLPVSGMRYSGDVSQFCNAGGVPAVYHGTDQTSAHGDLESVGISDLVRCARVLLGASLHYLGVLDQ